VIAAALPKRLFVNRIAIPPEIETPRAWAGGSRSVDFDCRRWRTTRNTGRARGLRHLHTIVESTAARIVKTRGVRGCPTPVAAPPAGRGRRNIRADRDPEARHQGPRYRASNTVISSNGKGFTEGIAKRIDMDQGGAATSHWSLPAFCRLGTACGDLKCFRGDNILRGFDGTSRAHVRAKWSGKASHSHRLTTVNKVGQARQGIHLAICRMVPASFRSRDVRDGRNPNVANLGLENVGVRHQIPTMRDAGRGWSQNLVPRTSIYCHPGMHPCRN